MKERATPSARLDPEEVVEQRIVLFVDDDPEILKVLRRMVRGMGLTVLTTTGPNASARASYAETLPLTSQRSSSRQA